MNRSTLTQRKASWLAAAALAIAATSLWAAQEPPAAPSKEMREKMAAAHERMAACLRSSKDIAECRTQMRMSCQAMGEQGCPMMGMGMGHGGGMRETPPDKVPRTD